jgi:hypothetical protein
MATEAHRQLRRPAAPAVLASSSGPPAGRNHEPGLWNLARVASWSRRGRRLPLEPQLGSTVVDADAAVA